MNVVIGAKRPKPLRFPCPTWFTSGPHHWINGRCEYCEIGLRDYRAITKWLSKYPGWCIVLEKEPEEVKRARPRLRLVHGRAA